jgi:hypothetical protein
MPLQPRRVTAKERYKVTVRTVERWEADPGMGFPPSVLINGRRYDDVEKLDAFDAACAVAMREGRQIGKRRQTRKNETSRAQPT